MVTYSIVHSETTTPASFLPRCIECTAV